jgi:hypothetical protein
VKDLNVFVASIETTVSLSKAKRKFARKTDKSLNLMMKWMSILWCYDRHLLGSIPPNHSARQFAENLTACGCPCKRTDIENGVKRQFKRFEKNSIPATKKTIEAFQKLAEIYPAIDPKEFLTSTSTTDWLTFNHGGFVCPFIAKLN